MTVLGVGYCTLNHIALVSELPRKSIELEIPHFSIQGSGSIANTLVALSNWDLSTRFVGKVANDHRGARIIETLSSEGVDTSYVVKNDNEVSQLSFTVVGESDNTRQTFYTAGTNSRLTVDEFDDSVLDGVDWYVCDDAILETQLAVLERAKETGCKTVVKATKASNNIDKLVKYADAFVASERIGSQYTGTGQLDKMLGKLLDKGLEHAFITLGYEGAVGLSDGDEKMKSGSPPDVNIVDTTGSGDTFLAGVTFGLQQNWKTQRIIDYGNAAAAINCTGLGARSQVPDYDEIMDLVD